MNRHQLLLAALLLLSFASSAQKKDFSILLKTGERHLSENVSQSFLDSFNTHVPHYAGKAYALIQFREIPGPAQKSLLVQRGIELLEYVPNFAYTATVKGNLNILDLQGLAVRAIIALTPEQKMHAALPKAPLPNWAVKVPGTIDVWVQFPKSFTTPQVLEALKTKNIDVFSADMQGYNILAIRIAANRLTELAAYPFIAYVQPAPPPVEPLNWNSRNGARANLLNAAVADGGRGLNGEGVTIGIGDNADIQQHIDFTGRLINRAATQHEYHGTHVTGIAAGGGIISEQARGYAPKATIVSQLFTGILSNAATYVKDYDMVVTNNSYGNIVGCDYNGLYDMYAHIMDQQAFELPHLQHVFASGNSGGDACAPFPSGFGTVLGGFQSAKNILCVGNTFASGVVATASSKGPVRDGRLKPEITTMGTDVLSTSPINGYSHNSGTSMAAPGATGGWALMYQRYRQLHNGANPKSGLIKALICNGAADKGNVGPDFSNGFGWMDLQRSLLMLEKKQFITGTATQGAVQNHTITVPQNTALVKVMLYWHDPAASLISSQALVHNLDLEVTGSNGALLLPQVLNASPTAVAQASVAGVDRLNNLEQVIIPQPVAGNYTIHVKGTAIGQNPAQEYFVVYDVIEEGAQLTFPSGGEALVPGEKVILQWDAFGNVSNSFYLQYSADGGTTWVDIKNDISATDRQYLWEVPNTVSANVKVRLVHNGRESTSAPFTIIGQPAVSLAPVQCEGYINLNWTPVAGATDYEVLLLRGAEMMPFATTTATSFSFNSLSKDSTYWVTVRARVNGKAGRRADAKNRQPSGGNCAGNLSDNDLKLAAITAPLSGRAATSTALGTAMPVRIEVKNLDDEAVSGFQVQYAINNGLWQTEQVTATIAPGAVYQHQFGATADLSATGLYTITAVVKNNGPDAAVGNDTLKKEIKHLPNAPINVAAPFVDDLEEAGAATFQTTTMGAGLHRYDFESNTAFGRLRTFVNTGMSFSGSKAFTLDADRNVSAGNTNYLTGTYNLGGYTAASNDLRLEFQYNQHGQGSHLNNKVWIRGDDTQPWVEAYTLTGSQGDQGIYRKRGNIELSELLQEKGQNFSSSFQIRWGQFGRSQTADQWSAAGYTIDNIRLFQAINDLQLVSIDAPIESSCGLSAATPVKISLYNSARTPLTQVPVKFKIDNGSWVEELIPVVAARDTLHFTFTNSANLATVGAHTLQAVVSLGTDNYRDNDTVQVNVVNSPVITAYPYLQNFEQDNGNWYTGGKNSSWQWGTPASEKIKGAASGTHAWKTRLAGNHNDDELSYLYSPCFNVSTLQNPTLSFSVALDLEDCGIAVCDGVWVEYSEDGKEWKKLPAASSTNWYNKTSDALWSVQNYTRWHVATTALPKSSSIRLRIVVSSDPAVNREDIAVDDIHVYDLEQPIYDGAALAAPVVKTVAGGAFVHFDAGGKRIASISSGNQNLGVTKVQAYIHTNEVRSQGKQYYHNRNLTIQPAEKDLKDSVTVRFYFLESESEALLSANSCTACTPPSSAYELGVTKYSDADAAFENGTLRDNQQGVWQFLNRQQVAIVPYDKGYYAEFKVKDFSEFWLNAGALNGASVLPLKLLHFGAQKEGADEVLLQWTTAAEDGVTGFDIELARSSEEVQHNRYAKIGEESSKGNSGTEQQYAFTDKESFKTGVRYYRLKIKNSDGSYFYSPVRSVMFRSVEVWQVYPNPSSGVFNLVYQAAEGTHVTALLTDFSGRMLATYRLQASGQVQKQELHLTAQPAGVYLLQVKSGDRTEVYKLYKQ